MSEVTIRWTQRAAGRDIGDEETVERTEFVDAIIKQGRVEVLDEVDYSAPVAPKLRTRRVDVIYGDSAVPEFVATNDAPQDETYSQEF